MFETGKVPTPIKLELDLADGFCNNKCPHCYYSTNIKNTPVFLDVKIAKKTINVLAENGLKSLELSGGGEPTTHEGICEIIQYAYNKGLDIGIITNGLLLDKLTNIADKLSYIRISLDAGSQDIYKKVHGINAFSTVIKNLSILKNHTSIKKISIAYLILDSNLNDILPAVKISKKIGCSSINFRPVIDLSPEIWFEAKQKITGALNTQDNNFKVFYSEQSNPIENYSKGCKTSPLATVVQANGDIALCASKRNQKNFIIGNIFDGGFFKHWGSSKHWDLIKNVDSSHCRDSCKFSKYNIIYDAYCKINSNFI